MDAISNGHAAHKTKSINVEVNMLESWLQNRAQLETKLKQRIATLIGICTAGLVLLPLADSYRRSASTLATQQGAKLVVLNKQVTELESKAKMASPSLENDAIHTSSLRRFDSYLGEVLALFNRAPEGVALTSFKSEVLGGEIQMRAVAEAESSSIGRTFVEKAGEGANVIASLQVSSRRSKLLGEQGISFDYVKKVKVGK